MEHYRLWNSAGTGLALHHVQTRRPLCARVVLAHGMFSNHRTCLGLAKYLSERGFDCWLLDFQGHGDSDKPIEEPCLEQMCLLDTDAVITFMQGRFPGEAIHWIGHSAGGLAIWMYLARLGHERCPLPTASGDRVIASVVTLASQAAHVNQELPRKLSLKLINKLVDLLGWAPGHWFRLGPEPEFASVLKQWIAWNITGRWLGNDGFDYNRALVRLTAPHLNLAAADDRYIAPPAACLAAHQRLGSRCKVWRLCGRETGFSENYTHARLISSTSAAKEVWPLIEQWLQSVRTVQETY